jgi:hypothetical protein
MFVPVNGPWLSPCWGNDERAPGQRTGNGRRSCMIDGALRTEAVTISDTLMIVRITPAMHTRASRSIMPMRPSSPLRGPFGVSPQGSGSQRGRLLASVCGSTAAPPTCSIAKAPHKDGPVPGLLSRRMFRRRLAGGGRD